MLSSSLLYLAFFLAGSLATIAGIVIFFARVQLEKLRNPNADWRRSDQIFHGNWDRFLEGIDEVFKDAPARSYIALSSISSFPSEGSAFFIRSAGKRHGAHSFVGELRLDSKEDRVHEKHFKRLLENASGACYREEKSYGRVILTSGKLDSHHLLIQIANEFRVKILEDSEDGLISISWHIPASRDKA